MEKIESVVEVNDYGCLRIFAYSAGLFVAIFAVWYWWPIWSAGGKFSFLEVFEKLATIVGAFGIFIAAYSYRDQKRKDRLAFFSEINASFLEKVVTAVEKFADYLLVKNLLVEQDGRLKVIGVSVEFAEGVPRLSDLPALIDHQKKVSQDREAVILQVVCLNSFEEIAIKILVSGVSESPLLRPIRRAFVSGINRCSVLLMERREAPGGDDLFNNALELYRRWQKFK